MSEFKLVTDESPNALERQVNDMLRDGWRLAGNTLAPRDCDGDYLLAQPMIKLDPEPVNIFVKTEYLMIEEYDVDDFNSTLSDLLDDGWKVYGIPNVSSDAEGSRRYSIMVEKNIDYSKGVNVELRVSQSKDIDEPVNNDTITK